MGPRRCGYLRLCSPMEGKWATSESRKKCPPWRRHSYLAPSPKRRLNAPMAVTSPSASYDRKRVAKCVRRQPTALNVTVHYLVFDCEEEITGGPRHLRP